MIGLDRWTGTFQICCRKLLSGSLNEHCNDSSVRLRESRASVGRSFGMESSSDQLSQWCARTVDVVSELEASR